MYAEDTAQARTIAGKIDEDPRWELLAVCATLADLNFVLDRAPVDVLLLRVTPQTDEGVLTAVRERTRHAHIPGNRRQTGRSPGALCAGLLARLGGFQHVHFDA
jgi:hypothetical protein